MTASESSESSESVPEDDNKRKFKEALERKKGNAAGGSDYRDVGGKQSRTHGPVEGRREFRRKSG
jgi:hypothetical protein